MRRSRALEAAELRFERVLHGPGEAVASRVLMPLPEDVDHPSLLRGEDEDLNASRGGRTDDRTQIARVAHLVRHKDKIQVSRQRH